MNNLLFNLPQEIIGKIYSQDETYVNIFTSQVLNNIYDSAVNFWKMKHSRKYCNKLSLEKFNLFLDYLIELWKVNGNAFAFNNMNEISLLSNDDIYIFVKINGDEFTFDGGIYNTEENLKRNYSYSNPYVTEINVYDNDDNSLRLLKFVR
jgi:hypothetical protein